VSVDAIKPASLTRPQRAGEGESGVAATSVSATILRGDATAPTIARVAAELPVALVFNGVLHTVTMASPGDLDDLARGFALTEDIIGDLDDVTDLHVVPDGRGLRVEIALRPECQPEIEKRRRRMVAGTACGLCGIESLDIAVMKPRRVGQALRLPTAALRSALAALPVFQPLNRETAAVHAAAWAERDGRILLSREDVGRHNALDKLIGALAVRSIAPADGFCLITSRCSTEMVQKAMMAGFELLVAVSAPTALALELAEAAGMTLVAVARADAQTVFTHPERLAS
jgi:FdhD protein